MKNWIIVILLVLLGISGYLYFSATPDVVIKEADISKELVKIDSLSAIIKDKNQEIDSLKDNVKVVKQTVLVKVKEVQELEITPSTELLKENLLSYGELTEDSSEYPVLNLKDSTVLLSQNNVRDINSIVEKYKGEVEINNNLENIISNDSIVISSQLYQLSLKDSIQAKKDEVYAENIKNLQTSIKKSSRKYKIAAWAGGILSAILLGINFAH